MSRHWGDLRRSVAVTTRCAYTRRVVPTSLLDHFHRAPVFVVGCPRSGTTLLQLVLNSHPDVAIAPETHFMRLFWSRRSEYGPLDVDARFSSLLDDIVARPVFAEMAVPEEVFRSQAWEGERTYGELFGLLLRLFGERASASVVGEKTPTHLLHMSTLASFFPKASFIHMVRDPRAVVASWRNVPWSTGTLQGDAEVWRHYAWIGHREAKKGRLPLLEVRYEDLVADPAPVLERVCRFLDVSFDARMLAHATGRHEYLNVSREPWKSGSVRPIDPTLAARWEKDLTPEDVRTIEAVAGSVMQSYRYQPRSTAPARFPVAVSSAVRRGVRKTTRRLERAREAGQQPRLITRTRS